MAKHLIFSSKLRLLSTPHPFKYHFCPGILINFIISNENVFKYVKVYSENSNETHKF